MWRLGLVWSSITHATRRVPNATEYFVKRLSYIITCLSSLSLGALLQLWQHILNFLTTLCLKVMKRFRGWWKRELAYSHVFGRSRLSWPRDAEVPAKWKPFCGWISILSLSWYVAAATLIAPAANASVDCSDSVSSTSGMWDRREAQCLWWAGSWLHSVWSTSSYKVELLSLSRVVNTCFKSWCCIAIANSSGLCKLTTIHVGQSLIYCRGLQ